MPETIIDSVLTGKLDANLLMKWLNNESIEDTPEDCILLCCNRNEFVAYFLSYLRNQTDSIIQTNNNALPIIQHQGTPEKIISTRRKHRRSISDPTSENDRDSLTVKNDRQRSHESPSKDRKRTGRRVKTKLFDDKHKDSISSDESRLSIGVDKIIISSTPMKNGLKLTEYPNLGSPVTPQSKSFERCDTPRLSHSRHSKSSEKSCLGDYLVNISKSSNKKKKRNTSNDESDTKLDLDLSNSDVFPEIGARKSSSLRSERRRIKPTNIDKSQKSLSLNSFNTECFQQPSPLALEDNVVFKQQKVQPKESKGFEVERNILKQERHKLMEKFNILNTNTSPKSVVTPQIKITSKDSIEKSQVFVTAESSKVVLTEKLDILIEIYDILLKNNLILSVNTELYFLISILLSKQHEDDYLLTEKELNENNLSYILKSIHNCTYFSVKSLWNQRVTLEIILDKNSLKILGENKKVRGFYPDLAKFLLNAYGLKCEAESQDKTRSTSVNRPSNGIICFNLETDNADNFPSMLSFQNFKKQRDMFYDIVRWYQETQQSGASRSTFRARIKALLCMSISAANHARLAALLVAHMLQDCTPNVQESKLSKLQRRLTCPTASDSHRLPHFTTNEMFYKEFISYAENESFRVHLRDALASEITVLDATPLTNEDRGNSNNTEITKDYLQISKKLYLLSKFLGYLTALPYSQTQSDQKSLQVRTEVKDQNYIPPKEKVLENSIALRNYSQPCIDITGMLKNSYTHQRLIITIPWIVQYLSLLEYTTLRTNYYKNLLKILLKIYTDKLNSQKINRNTTIFLQMTLGWLFSLPHFPQELFYEKFNLDFVMENENLDSCDVIDEFVMFELCPFLKDLGSLLSTCRVSQVQKDMGSYRHITPVSLSLNAEDRIRNKERELQARLEEELLKSQPSSTRRALELITERVSTCCVRELSRVVTDARQDAADTARHIVLHTHLQHHALLETLQKFYADRLQQLRKSALESATLSIKRRAASALSALLPSAAPPLQALAVKACVNRVTKWLNDNWCTTAILCKDIEAEMKNLLAVGELTPTQKSSVDVTAMMLPGSQFDAVHVSAATVIINLKEQICLLLDYEDSPDVSRALSMASLSCATNNMFCRAPTQRALHQLTIDLALVYVSRKPKEIATILPQLDAIWNNCCPDRKKNTPEELSFPERRELSPDFRNFEDDRAPTPISDDENEPRKSPVKFVIDTKNTEKLSPTVKKPENPMKFDTKLSGEKLSPTAKLSNEKLSPAKLSVTVNSVKNDECLEFFDRILCPRNIVLLCDTKCSGVEVWEAMATLLVFLLKNDYLSEDSLTEQCLAVYRQDWPQVILENLSVCMKSVSSRWSRSSTGKFTLFLDFLAEYCGDMDYEPMD